MLRLQRETWFRVGDVSPLRDWADIESAPTVCGSNGTTGDNMKKHLLTIITIILAIIFIYSVTRLVIIFYGYNQAENTYEDAVHDAFVAVIPDSGEEVAVSTLERSVSVAARVRDWFRNLTGTEEEAYSVEEVEFVSDVPYVEPSPPEPFDVNVDFASLKAINPEVCAWIWIPDTTVCYPVVQHSDNDYYLDMTYKNVKNRSGSIFIDSRCSSDFSGRNTILFGHNMLNNTMFSSLTRYGTQSYFNAHPYVYIITESGITVYEIFSAYGTAPDGMAYHVLLTYDELYQGFLDEVTASSKITTGITPTIDDQILTLSTCTTDTEVRFVVLARMRR